jgi:glycosyltransferase involved in cell wall biosynthesis
MVPGGNDRAMKHLGLIAIGGPGWMGGANYVRHLAAAVRAAAPDVRVSFVCGSVLAQDWRDAEPRVEVAVRPSLVAKVLGRGTPLRAMLARAEIEFAYPITYDNEYNLGVRFPIGEQLGAAQWAGWVPDFQHRFLPELFPPDEIRRRDTNIAQLAAEAPRVVFSSESAAADFRAFYPEHAAKSMVLTFATTPFALPGEIGADDAPPRFFLVCNQFWKHKNHLLVFEALHILRTRGIRPLVLCTGQLDDYRDRAFADAIHAALARDGLGEQVMLLGLIPRTRQIALMRRAIAIVQPSLFEGWSTVVEDARVLGRPCLLSDLAVHREQDPPGARFFAPRSAEALADLVAEAWAHWPAGPDHAAEAVAQERAQARLLQVGRRLLAIAGA